MFEKNLGISSTLDGLTNSLNSGYRVYWTARLTA